MRRVTNARYDFPSMGELLNDIENISTLYTQNGIEYSYDITTNGNSYSAIFRLYE